ncbi:MAG TPA: hypothetical protein VL175_05200 [Pirellulales bacterium]|jgi:hypothetical protein|nr:hypothetical protein [Pirellulales bacterium]
MESSTLLAFRIFVMLSCLVIVPMAAIFGSAFPDVVKTVLVDRLVAWSTGKPLESKPAGEPDGFSRVSAGEPARGNAQWEAPRWGGPTGENAAWQQQPVASAPAVVPAAGGVPQAGQPAAVFASASEPARMATASTPVRSDEIRRGNEMSPVAAPVATPPKVQVPGERTGPLPAEGETDRFTAMERKLREYGAVYYLLETWGNEGELYRFHCRMAMANNPSYSRHFEASDRDALRAMSQVLSKVEAWRAGRLQ